jgi:hypothetical protein
MTHDPMPAGNGRTGQPAAARGGMTRPGGAADGAPEAPLADGTPDRPPPAREATAAGADADRDPWLDAEPPAPRRARAEAFTPDGDELRALVRLWSDRRLDLDLEWLLNGSTGGWESRTRAYAGWRLGLIEALLGEGPVQAVVDEAEADARRRLGDETWRVFTAGTDAERARVADATCAEHDRLVAKRDDPAACAAALAALGRAPGGVFLDAAGDLWHLADPPRAFGPPPGRLVLKLRTRAGHSGFARNHEVDRPAGWVAPYGLR